MVKVAIKQLTTQKPICKDERAIVTLLECIGYRVKRTYPQWGGMLYVVFTDDTCITRKHKGNAKRKIEQRLPMKLYDVWKRQNIIDGQRVTETVAAVEIDSMRSVNGINDLLSTFEAQT